MKFLRISDLLFGAVGIAGAAFNVSFFAGFLIFLIDEVPVWVPVIIRDFLRSASIGESTPVFEPIHGSWPQAKGLNIANPLAQVLSVAMLFEYFNLKEEGNLIRRAVDASLDANVRTPEIQVEGAPKYGTKEIGQWLVEYIKQN